MASTPAIEAALRAQSQTLQTVVGKLQGRVSVSPDLAPRGRVAAQPRFADTGAGFACPTTYNTLIKLNTDNRPSLARDLSTFASDCSWTTHLGGHLRSLHSAAGLGPPHLEAYTVQPSCKLPTSQIHGGERTCFRKGHTTERWGRKTSGDVKQTRQAAARTCRAAAIEQPYGSPARKVPDSWDVVGLGQAMVDFSGIVSDEFLEKLGLEKGKRKVVNHEERGKVLRALDGNSYKVSAGGSLSNTLVALARLGQGDVNVAMTGSVGSDPLGDFYRAKLLRAKVHFLSRPIPDGTTGTVVVLTTPDAQRTMLAYQGMSSFVQYDSALEGAIASSKMMVVEGYLWELPETVEAIGKACAAARARGSVVVLTASDVSCVLRFRKSFWDVMCESTDILFTNADEARALSGFSSSTSPALTARHLSRFCPLVSVTDGDKGSYLGLKGEVAYIPPSPCIAADTCGAGDAYAAGILYSLLVGVPDLRSMGNFAARVAAVVVGQQGTRLKEESAEELSAGLKFNKAPLWEGTVFRNMGLESSTGAEKKANV